MVGPEPETMPPSAPYSMPGDEHLAEVGAQRDGGVLEVVGELRGRARAGRRCAGRVISAGVGDRLGHVALPRSRSHSAYTAGVDRPPSASAKTQW